MSLTVIEYLPAVSVFTRLPAGDFNEIVKLGPTVPASGFAFASATVTPTTRAMQSAAATRAEDGAARPARIAPMNAARSARVCGAGSHFTKSGEEDVGCLYVETDESVCLIDPLVPADERDAFLRHLDADVARAGSPCTSCSPSTGTCGARRRSSSGTARRSGRPRAACSRSTGASASTRNPLRPGDVAPGGIEAHASGRAAEVVFVVPSHGALVAGDVLLGSPLRICPAGWVGKGGQQAVREALRPLVRPSLRAVIPSHGDAVLVDAERALAAALG